MKKIAKFLTVMSVFALMVVAVCACNGDGDTTTYKVTFDLNGGQTATEIQTQTLKPDQIPVKPTEPTRDGYTFKGWYMVDENGDFTGNEYNFDKALGKKDVTLKAKWASIFTMSGTTVTGIAEVVSGSVLKVPAEIDGVAVTALGADVLKGQKNITELRIPASVTFINGDFWNYAGNITLITVDSANTNFVADNNALYNTAKSTIYWIFNRELTTFEIPATVTALKTANFQYLDKLTSITVAQGNSVYAARGGLLYSNKGATLEIIPNGYTGEVNIDTATTFINPNTLLYATKFAKFTVAADHTMFKEIDHLIYRMVNNYYMLVTANRDYDGVATILKDVDLSVAHLSGIGSYAFSNSKLSGIRYTDTALITSIDLKIFQNVKDGFKVYVPNGKTKEFTSVLNSKWSEEVRAFIAGILVEDK